MLGLVALLKVCERPTEADNAVQTSWQAVTGCAELLRARLQVVLSYSRDFAAEQPGPVAPILTGSLAFDFNLAEPA